MPGFGWSLILRQPSAVAHAPAREMATQLLPPLLAVSLLLLLVGLLARALARPLSGLVATAEAMAMGRLDEPVPERRDHREAAILSAALARLQSALTRAPSTAAPAPQPVSWHGAERLPIEVGSAHS